MSNISIIQGDSKLIPLNDESVQCCISSVPYFGLRSYLKSDNSLKLNEIGQEQSPQEYVANVVQVYREVKRVLRKDGVAFLNVADSYAGSGKGRNKDGSHSAGNDKQHTNTGAVDGILPAAKGYGIKDKSLCLIPQRLAISLSDDGWIVRSIIIWNKPATMPESVTDRPTRSYEHILMLTKSKRYYWDSYAIATEAKQTSLDRLGRGISDKNKWLNGAPGQHRHSLNRPRQNVRFGGNRHSSRLHSGNEWNPEKWVADALATAESNFAVLRPTANARDIQTWANAGTRHAHYAVFPIALPNWCIRAATSERGCCPKCGKPWVRVISQKVIRTPKDAKESPFEHENDIGRQGTGETTLRDIVYRGTEDWRSNCHCNVDPVPCVVYDPFAGSGTTLIAARQLGRSAIGQELSPKYIKIAEKRLAETAYTHRYIPPSIQLEMPFELVLQEQEEEYQLELFTF